MKTLNLQLTIDDANLILEALGGQPYIKVFALINKLQSQASQQLPADNAVISDLPAFPPKE